VAGVLRGSRVGSTRFAKTIIFLPAQADGTICAPGNVRRVTPSGGRNRHGEPQQTGSPGRVGVSAGRRGNRDPRARREQFDRSS
jgi:hypothetical protein